MDHLDHLAAAALRYGAPAHCSAPPLHAAFRLPRLPRDVESVTRPRMPLRPTKREESEADAVCEFGIDLFDDVVVKVEAEEAAEAPIEVEEVEERREVRAQFAALQVAPAATSSPRGPGRPKGSKSRPRVAPRYDWSAPPERGEAKKASARIAANKR